MSDEPKPYYCLYCMRAIEPKVMENGSVLYVHDDVIHPTEATYDEEEKPQ